MSEHWQVENGYNTSFITGSNPVLTTKKTNIMQEDLYGVPDNGVDDVETTPRNNYGQVEED
jgi:hypothetical protein